MASFRYIFHSGKNPKWRYFFASCLRTIVPGWIWRAQREAKIRKAMRRPDWDAMQKRVDYYCRLSDKRPLPTDAETISKALRHGKHVYRFDTARYTRWFNPQFKMSMLPGDIMYVPDVPSLLKSRPIASADIDNTNSVLLKLNAVRHFIFVDDKIPFATKRNMAVFRGKVYKKPLRERFFEAMFGKSFCDLGDISKSTAVPAEWKTPKMTISEHLQFKFVLALEGNDVASNLKWIMSSNSIAISPRMRYETWFMEGTLVPNYHYIEIKDDFSDLEEKIQYYASHVEEAEEIIRHAHEYVDQFRDQEREELLGLLVCDKYFRLTGNIP